MSSNSVNALIISYGVNLLLAVVGLILGLLVIGRITHILRVRLETRDTDASLMSFLVPLVKVTLQILLIVSIISVLGFEVTSLVAVIGAATFAVGLALQGSLANFAGGVLLILLKPFQVGDFIEAAGFAGTVQEIQVFHTILNTADNRRIVIPNGNLSNTSTVNFSVNPTRRINFEFGVGYEDDINLVKDTLQGIADEHPLILREPAPQIVLAEHGDSAVVYYMRVWCQRQDYWTIYFEVLETAKRQFDAAGINIPYPQMDVHVNSNDVSIDQ